MILLVNSGVPQGSILGLLLFPIFINDIPSFVSTSSVLLYADDTKCFNSIKSSSDASSLQDDLLPLSKWSKYWCLSFKKCMRFNIKSPLYFNYLIEDTFIANKSFIKDLGVLILSDLTWSLHVSYIIG